MHGIHGFKKSQEVFAKRNTCGAFPLSFSTGLRFINMLQNNQYFNTHYKIPLFLSHRFTLDHDRDSRARRFTIDISLLSVPDIYNY